MANDGNGGNATLYLPQRAWMILLIERIVETVNGISRARVDDML
jgi:hypothetical protein